MEAFYGILIPFLGTSLGAACVFFMKKSLSDAVQRSLTGFAAGVMVAASRVEPADPGHRAVGGDGPTLVSAGVSRLLGRHFLFAAARPRHPAPAREKRAGRGAEEPAAAHDDDGAGRDAAQHPGGHGRRRGVRGLSVRQRADHGGGRAGALARHRHPEFPGGGDHLPAAARRGHEQSKSVSGAACSRASSSRSARC